MKLQLNSYGKTMTFETENDDVPLEEYFEAFEGLLVQATFSQSSIREFIIERADELKDLEYFESKQKNHY
jgi:hypothetical protein